ncbi:hypothetical protein [Mycobacterium sp.]|jgi:hypothetical protein|uniref:hypothetical protein n=1 Tax=Mycobacterium sp. TaxID=1785 RepID=UPI0028B9550F|nr:hypothetical protein [Mycobacterium sp.]MDT5052246.1 hypothetical protein [Mycobacterium sp.]
MARGIFESPLVRIVNGVAVGLINAPILGNLIGRGLVVVRYVGRRSGKTFEMPVGYRRTGEALVIGVASPDAKNWWRNFLGEGGPITLVDLDGADRTGHAVADRDDNGRVRVTVQLD